MTQDLPDIVNKSFDQYMNRNQEDIDYRQRIQQETTGQHCKVNMLSNQEMPNKTQGGKLHTEYRNLKWKSRRDKRNTQMHRAGQFVQKGR